MNEQTMQLIEAITNWHAHHMNNLDTILSAPDGTDIKFMIADGEESVIPGDSDLAKGIRMGIAIAKGQFEKLPFTVSRVEE